MEKSRVRCGRWEGSPYDWNKKPLAFFQIEDKEDDNQQFTRVKREKPLIKKDRESVKAACQCD